MAPVGKKRPGDWWNFGISPSKQRSRCDIWVEARLSQTALGIRTQKEDVDLRATGIPAETSTAGRPKAPRCPPPTRPAAQK